MKKLFTILLLFLFTSIAALAQSVSKQINDVKRSSHYISAEATMETEAQAYELAEELLSKQISEFASSQKTLKKAPNVIVKDVAGKAEKLQMSRGTMVRVFLYVKKDDIIAADNTRVLIQPQTQPEETIKTETDKKSAKKEKEKQKKSGEVDEPFVSTVEPVSQPYDTTTSEGDKSLLLPISWQQAVIDDLLACPTITEVRGLIARLHAEKKIKRFGSADNCPNSSNSFWVIFNAENQVVTVLGNGQAERTNFRTLTKDTLSNYKGKGAIWFTLSK